MKCFWIILPGVLVLTGCSTSFDALHPEFGSSFNVYDCPYNELWDVAVEVAGRTQKNRWSAITTKGDTLTGIFLERLLSDTLQFTRLGQRFSLLVTDVLQLRESKERRFWDWVGTGAILGGVAGSLLGPSLSEVQFKGSYGSFYGAFHGIAYGAIVGGALEEIARGDRVYDLQKMEPPDRVRTIEAILSNRM